MDYSWPGFERAWANAIVDSINFVREAAGLTIKELRSRVNDLGWPVTDATLSGVLSGRKRGSFSVAEVFVFARALNVSPLFLALGLPKHGQLPPSPAWSDLTPDAPRLAGWASGRDVFAPFGDDDLTPDPDSNAYIAAAMARQAMDDLLSHANAMRAIQWQAAQLLALSEFPRRDVERAAPLAPIRDQDFLWGAINQLSHARRAQRRLGAEYGVPLPELPPALRFIDVDPPIQMDDPDLATLATLTDARLVARARVNIQQLLDSLKNTEGGDPGGQAADADQ